MIQKENKLTLISNMNSDIIDVRFSERERKGWNHSNNENMIYASSDHVDLEMEKHLDRKLTTIVLNGHQKQMPKRLQKFISPLRVPKRLKSRIHVDLVVGDKKRKPFFNSNENCDKIQKKIKREQKNAAEQFILQVCKVDIDTSGPIYDSCTELVQKTKSFLSQEGVQKAMFVRALGVHYNSLDRFLVGKGQDQRCNGAYGPIYFFFEKLRIFYGEAKSKERTKNEIEQPEGFILASERERKQQQTKETVRFGIIC